MNQVNYQKESKQDDRCLPMTGLRGRTATFRFTEIRFSYIIIYYKDRNIHDVIAAA